MNTKQLEKTALLAVISVFAILVLIGTATFAWFTSNSRVSTSTVTGKSGTSSMKLLIGGDEGNLEDSSETEVALPQVNDAEEGNLLPVSTADLETFYYASGFSEGKAVTFEKDTEEKKIWHGKIYLRLQGENAGENVQFKLYLDTAESAGGNIGQASDGNLLSGARLGLKFDEQDPVILRFDEESKGTTENNTMVNGQVLSSGYVLDSNLSPVEDPSIEMEKVSLNSSEETVLIPERELATLTVNQTVGVDVYFYIEGCDEDSVVELAKNEAEIHLAFYAIAEQ